ncbi:MAG: lysozyme [Pseudomonadota bacterium]
MHTSTNGVQVMHYFEQCRLKAYPDPATGGDPWTIGWGDVSPDVKPGLIITQDEADARFAKRLTREFEPGVSAALTRMPSQAQFDGMVCLAYNIGLGNFKNSTLVRKFNAGDDAGAAEQFLVWNKAAGKVMLGLRRRRAAERALFLGMNGDQAIAIGAAIQ